MAEQDFVSDGASYMPYDALYPRVHKTQLNLYEYVVGKERLDQPGYPLNLGAFVHFALEFFPRRYPSYHLPDPLDQEGEHLLELFLRACYGKRFVVGTTSFHAEVDRGIQRRLPQWAIRWMQLWRQLPPGMLFGKEEVLCLLDLLWNLPIDARGVLDAQLDHWLYSKLFGDREAHW
jgi:hypothetical protein